jgi:hypothetical protein
VSRIVGLSVEAVCVTQGAVRPRPLRVSGPPLADTAQHAAVEIPSSAVLWRQHLSQCLVTLEAAHTERQDIAVAADRGADRLYDLGAFFFGKIGQASA